MAVFFFIMIGSGNPTPYDAPALVALVLLCLILLFGCILGPRWDGDAAAITRWSAAVISVLVLAAVHGLTPTPSGLIGAGRLVTLWPVFVVNLLLFIFWTWRMRA